MLTALGHIQLLRYVGPAAVVLGVAPQYLLTWIAWRLASLPLPRRVYQRGDEFLYDMYQSLVCFFFETCTGAEVTELGLSYYCWFCVVLSATSHLTIHHVKTLSFNQAGRMLYLMVYPSVTLT